MSGSRDQNRIQPVDPDHASGAIRQLFAGIRTKFAMVPNLFRAIANAPAALEGLLGLSAALARGTLDEKTREQLALAVAESNLCAYCLSGHTAMATKIGLSRVEIDDAIRASAADARTDAILKLARSIVVQRGELTDADLARARAVGLGDGEIVETVANVALNIFENYMSHVARVPIDFPKKESRETSSQGGESNGQR
ncbi:MAG TPA: carboxymuconolactone decarboxylase family protein [Candidatus Limnocylindrales bacterium]|nr:carboxymuconolactone decarboxylase family protein [Candidatus Limnocylindrales bacterium]